MPEGDTRTDLKRLVDSLAAAHDAPPFEPHVTLIGQLMGDPTSVLDRCETLAERIAPFQAQLGDLGHESVWTRWLFRWVTPSDAVMQANVQARALFGRHDDRPYTPHLSLMYGEFEPQRTQVLLSADPGPPLNFPVDTLHAVSTQGPVQAWSVLASFPLVPDRSRQRHEPSRSFPD
jgi:2'-5' RNA ligase